MMRMKIAPVERTASFASRSIRVLASIGGGFGGPDPGGLVVVSRRDEQVEGVAPSVDGD